VRHWACSVFAVCLCASGAAADEVAAAKPEKGRIGIDAAFNGTTLVGLTWHVGERLALRPAIAFLHSSDTSGLSSTPLPTSFTRDLSNDGSSSAYEAQLSLLYFLRKAGGLRPYLGATYYHTHSSGDSTRTETVVSPTTPPPTTVPEPLALPATEKYRADTDGGRAFLGLQHGFGERFRIFGEMGLSFAKRSTTSTSNYFAQRFDPVTRTFVPEPITSSVHNDSKSVGSFNAEIGLVFYLK
jgi:hypothetical protein